MAALGATALSLVDWAQRTDPKGKVIDIVEMLSQTNCILEDGAFVEANLPTGHVVAVRTGLPVSYYRALNAGIPLSKSTVSKVTESVAMLEAYSEIDKDLALLNGNTAEFRMSEDQAFLESMNQAMADCLIYGNSATDPKQFLGFAPRYNTIAGAVNSQNIIDAGGVSTNNTSVWLVTWHDQTCFMTFPKGSKAGLQHEDLGIDTVIDSVGGRYQAYRTHYQWKNGLVVKDWRYVARICNINTANLVAESSAADLVKLMSRAIDRLPNQTMGKKVFYVNRTVGSMLRIQALNKSNAALAIAPALNQFGNNIMELQFLGIPVRIVDRILNTEARIV